MKEVAKTTAEKLPELEQQTLGLFMPQALPDSLPSVCMQLLPGLVTHLRIHPLGKQTVAASLYKAGTAWCEPSLTLCRVLRAELWSLPKRVL